MLSGPLPTPAVAHLTTSMRADAGVVISASHNPFEDNGIKIFASDGFKLPDDAELEIERLIEGNELDKQAPARTPVGRAERLDDAPGRYVAFVKQTFPQDLYARRATHRGRRRARRRLPRGARRLPRAGRRGGQHRRPPRRPEHQSSLRRHPPRDLRARGGAQEGRTSASASTATPTA